MADSMLKTAALLAGAAVSLGAARRFSRRVPAQNQVAVFEEISRLKGKKGSKLMIGYPVEQINEDPISSDLTKKQRMKLIRAAQRKAKEWLRKTSTTDGKRRANRTLGGNRDAVCEFELVQRTRDAKGKAIGVTKRCFTLGSSITETVTDTVREEVAPPSRPPIPEVLPDFPLFGYGEEEE
jgi:hypothetical protein